MGKFVNPFTDIGFKIIFGSELSKGLLITFLNEMLKGEYEIVDFVYLDKEDHGSNVRDRGIVYDLYCRTSDNCHIIIEMQNRWHKNFLDRTLHYVCRSISRQSQQQQARHDETDAQEPKDYYDRYKLSAVYGVFLMNFREYGLEKKFRTDTVVADQDTGRAINTNFRQIYLQFPCFTKELEECETLFEKMIYTLKNMHKWDRMPEALKEQVFQRLAELAEVANLSEENQIAYDRALDSYNVDQQVHYDDYMEGMEDGLEKGRREGKKEGIRKVAFQMLKDGLSLDVISRYTGLSAQELALMN